MTGAYTQRESTRYCEMCGADLEQDSKHTSGDAADLLDGLREWAVECGSAIIGIVLLKLANPAASIEETAKALALDEKAICAAIEKAEKLGLGKVVRGCHYSRHLAQSARRDVFVEKKNGGTKSVKVSDWLLSLEKRIAAA